MHFIFMCIFTDMLFSPSYSGTHGLLASATQILGSQLHLIFKENKYCFVCVANVSIFVVTN